MTSLKVLGTIVHAILYIFVKTLLFSQWNFGISSILIFNIEYYGINRICEAHFTTRVLQLLARY